MSPPVDFPRYKSPVGVNLTSTNPPGDFSGGGGGRELYGKLAREIFSVCAHN